MAARNAARRSGEGEYEVWAGSRSGALFLRLAVRGVRYGRQPAFCPGENIAVALTPAVLDRMVDLFATQTVQFARGFDTQLLKGAGTYGAAANTAGGAGLQSACVDTFF